MTWRRDDIRHEAGREPVRVFIAQTHRPAENGSYAKWETGEHTGPAYTCGRVLAGEPFEC